jgi:hypothetical protein
MRLARSDAVCVLAAAALLYMTALSAMETERSSYELWTGLFCAGLCLLPMALHQAAVMHLPFAFVVLMVSAIFLHGYGVLLMKYDDLVWYDTITHTVSTIAVGLCVFYALSAVAVLDHNTSFGSRAPMVLAMILLTFSVYWEVFELVVDMIWSTNMQYSPWDTVRDMVCNTAGSVWIISFSTLYLRARTGPEFVDRLELHPSLRALIVRSRAPPVDEAEYVRTV